MMKPAIPTLSPVWTRMRVERLTAWAVPGVALGLTPAVAVGLAEGPTDGSGVAEGSIDGDGVAEGSIVGDGVAEGGIDGVALGVAVGQTPPPTRLTLST